MARNSLASDARWVADFMLPIPLPYDLRRLILEFSGLVHFGKRQIVWFHYF